MIKVFVSGATGNVGSQLVKALVKSEDLDLAGGFCTEEGAELGSNKNGDTVYGTSDLTGGLNASGADVVVDFTSTRIIMENLRIYASAGVDAVIGTTGFSEQMLAEARELANGSGTRWAVISNFGLGINLLLDFLKTARKHYPHVSVIDRHPARMANAPSGTAVALARALSEGPQGNVQSQEVIPGVLGGKEQGVQILSQRLPYPGPYSEHEVVLGRQDEVIRINVQDFSSGVYVDGVFLALRKIGEFPRGTLVTEFSEFGG
ncbi:MAG: 4-hydroxy-tetrahydrodipicolinate reductase [Thermovirgaceae bacterium]